MREKPICTVCSKKFTRKSNMLRHMKDIHNVFQNTFKKNSAFPNIQLSKSKTIDLLASYSVENLTPLTPLERTWVRIVQVLKGSSEYMKLLNLLQDNNNLRAQIALREREIRELRERNRILPHRAFQGLSGYLCRRCSAFNFIHIQHIGYDKTMISRHQCDAEKVVTPKDVSAMNLQELWQTLDQYDIAANQMLDVLNLIMPGKKYLIAEDMSSKFNFVESAIHHDISKTLLGIPDRFSFHKVSKELMSDWITRVVANMGKKTNVEDFEIRDFLRRVTSTYAIFEIPTDRSPRRILIKITS